MKNWAGNLSFTPTGVLAPTSSEEALTFVRHAIAAKKKIRMRGSAHSWTELISTPESFIHLDGMQGILEVNSPDQLIRAQAGTKLKLFGEEAFKHLLALPNQGDINQQSLAGALSTGTHGTGVTLQSMSNQLRSLRLITGTGDLLDVEGDRLDGLAVSLGSAGLITEMTLKLTDAYRLKVETFAEDMSESMGQFKARLSQNRHLEMFYFPVGDWSMVKLMNQTEDAVIPESKLTRLSDLVLENWFFEALNVLALKTNSYKKVDRLMRKFVGHKIKTDWSHRAFPTERSVRFMEMEFNLPLEKFEAVFDEVKKEIKASGFETLFPIEIRFVKGDKLWLSPAYGRDSVYFAVHTYIGEDHRPYFEALQKIFLRHGGRPHWGKWHSLKQAELAPLYPRWDDFKRLRNEMDPAGLWLNNHLENIFS